MKRLRARRGGVLLLMAVAVVTALAVFVGTRSPSPKEAPILGVSWQWQRTVLDNGQKVTPEHPGVYTLELTQDGWAHVRADCNGASGRYVTSGPRIDFFEGFDTTLIGCPPDSLGEDFLRQLGVVVSYVARDGELILAMRSDSGSMRFARAPQASRAVTGVVTYQERVELPPDAVVKVQLLVASRADAPGRPIGEQVIPTMGRQVPVPFSVNYAPTAIDPRFHYTLSAQIVDGRGGLLWINTQAHPVITQGHLTRDVEVVVMMVRR